MFKSAPKTPLLSSVDKLAKEREFLGVTADTAEPSLKRPVRVTFRLTHEEAAALRRHCFDANTKQQSYILDKILPDLNLK